MKVYLAGPMAGNMDEQDYRRKIKKILKKLDIEYICPMELDFAELGKEETDRIAEVGNGHNGHTDEDIAIIKKMIKRDKEAIDECNVMIAYVPFASHGTDMEIFYNSDVLNQITIIFSKSPKSWVLGMGDYFVNSYSGLERLLVDLLKIENGD